MKKQSTHTELCFQPERLTKLAAYLVRSHAHSKIDLLEDEDNICQTNPEAINVIPVFANIVSALPRIFPREWAVNNHGEYVLTNYKNISSLSSIIIFFGLEAEMFLHVFVPYGQSLSYGGNYLTKHATPKQIAENILNLIMLKSIEMKFHTGVKIFISKN